MRIRLGRGVQTKALVCTLALGAMGCPCALRSQTASPSSPQPQPQPDLAQPPQRWAEAAAANEERVVNYDVRQSLRYRVHRRDSKGEVLREVIDSSDGPVARLLQRDGQPLTAAEDAAERERLQSMLSDSAPFYRHQHREAGSRAYATELLHAMPRAMTWTYAPGQPQLPGTMTGNAVVLDFMPDPQFKPPSLITEGLTGIAGRVWIDPVEHVVLSIQGRVLHPVDFGWGGVLARVRDGGSIQLTQRRAPNGRWLYAHVAEHLAIREVFVHTTEENADTTTSDVQVLAHPVPYQTAIQMLLAIPVTTR